MIVYVPFHDSRKWEREGLRTRDAHVAEHLAHARHPIVVVDRPTCLAELVKLRGAWTPRGRTASSGRWWRLVDSDIGFATVDTIVPQIGFRRLSFHRWQYETFGTAAFGRRIEEALGAAGADSRSTLWLSSPFAVPLRRLVAHERLVVDAFDNFAIHPELRRQSREVARAAYREIAEHADAIVANSERMQEYLWQEFTREAKLVPNGVDVPRFASALPARLGVPHPVVGYAGKLAQRIDVDLIIQLANELTSGTVVLAGQVLNRGWVRRLFSHPRIRHLGDIRYERLPSFLAACTVCIVPHRVGPGENDGDATKIYEYLAAGRPVVTTAIGGVRRFHGRVMIARDAATFVGYVNAVIAGTASVTGEVCPDETWEARVAAILDHFGMPAGSGDPATSQ